MADIIIFIYFLQDEAETNRKKKNADDKNKYKSPMFRNNPEVPAAQTVAIFSKQVDSKTVQKNKNSLFSTSTYKDLTDLHAHMVMATVCIISVIIMTLYMRYFY